MTSPPRPSLLRAAVLAARPCSSAALARSLGAAALAVSATGCLVISPPEYEHPEQTAPVLTAVFPPPHRPVHINSLDPLDKIRDFGATVLSEDNGEPVQVALYIDYGKRTSDAYPYRRFVALPPIAAGTIAAGQRPIRAKLDLNRMSIPDDEATPERECHTFTIMASHAFNANKCDCPDDPDDMSWITWQLINCDPDEPTCPTSCPALNCEGTRCLFCNEIQEPCPPDATQQDPESP